ncbi:MAG: hypothetical protein M1816_000193 [Peltula sp. TS41687]|nr:MAG: hypothetical protein M1816_000193 [Peltula sp. TS41687]
MSHRSRHGDKRSSNRGPGGGRGGGGGGGGGASREVQISKAMSFILRHGAQREGLKLDERGYARVDELLLWPRLSKLRVSFTELQSIVQTNEKQRFALIRREDAPSAKDGEADTNDQDPSRFLIRATQGHSIAIAASNLLTPLTLDAAPASAVHGSYRAAWPLILASGGLKKMRRTHIHFAPAAAMASSISASASATASSSSPLNLQPDGQENRNNKEEAVVQEQEEEGGGEEEEEEEAEQLKIISGMRTSADLHIYVNIHRSMREGGVEWWRSANGVLLTEGSKETGVLGTEWFDEVHLVDGGGGEGKVLWRDGKEVERLSEKELKGGARMGLGGGGGREKNKKRKRKEQGQGRSKGSLGRKGDEIDDHDDDDSVRGVGVGVDAGGDDVR